RGKLRLACSSSSRGKAPSASRGRGSRSSTPRPCRLGASSRAGMQPPRAYGMPAGNGTMGKTRARQRAAPWRPFPRRRCRRRKTLLPLADHVNNQPRQLLLLVFVGRFPKLLEDALLRVLRVNVVREEIANDLRFVGDLPVAHAHGAADVNGLGQGLPPLGPVLHLQVQPVSTPFRLENVRAINVPWRPVSYVCLLRDRKSVV